MVVKGEASWRKDIAAPSSTSMTEGSVIFPALEGRPIENNELVSMDSGIVRGDLSTQ